MIWKKETTEEKVNEVHRTEEKKQKKMHNSKNMVIR